VSDDDGISFALKASGQHVPVHFIVFDEQEFRHN